MNMCALRKDNVYKTYANMLRLDGYKQLTHTPTRITPTTKSSLDHIIWNSDDKISQYGLLRVGLVFICYLLHQEVNKGYL